MSSPFTTPAPAKRGMSLSFPPDQPFVADGVDQSDGLTGDQRREAQRHLTRVHQHTGEVEGMEMAIRDCRINLALQSAWWAGGAYLIRRGFRYTDHTHSFARSFTQNLFVCKLMNPISLVGLVVAGVTTYQLPNDVRTLLAAHQWHAKAVAGRDKEAGLFEDKMRQAAELRKSAISFDEAKK